MNAIFKSLLLLGALFSANAAQADTIKILTEEHPPLNMKDGDKITGTATDIVRELMKRANVTYTLDLVPWERGYETTLNQDNYALYSTTRTPAREPLFKWVGPLAQNDWVLVGKKSKNIKINTIEDARKYVIGGYTGDAKASYLEHELHFKVALADNEDQNLRKVISDRIDLWVTGDAQFRYATKQAGITDLESVFNFRKVGMYLAFNKDTPDALIQKLNATLEDMHKDGTFDKLSAQ